MLTVTVGLVIGSLFWLGYVAVRPCCDVRLTGERFWPATLLLLAFFWLPVAFLVKRTNGTAILEEGLTSSNVITLAVVGSSVLYLGWIGIRNLHIINLLRDRVLFPFYLAGGVSFLSAAWSVVPSYTIFRAIELIAMFTLAVIVFDRNGFRAAFVRFHMLLLFIWLLLFSGDIAEQLSHGIVFSSGKNNLTPLLCLSVFWYLWHFPIGLVTRLVIGTIAVVGFIVGGSAATVSVIPVMFSGRMVVSREPAVRLSGIAITAIFLVLSLYLLVAMDSFPELTESISALLQKPVEELTNGTGRIEFWPLFIEAGESRYFGLGYAAGERFIQLSVGPAAVAAVMGNEELLISSAHNMFIGVWVATGWLGVAIMILCFASAWREAMRLDHVGRRFVIPLLIAILLNGVTVPGIFSEFNMHTVTWSMLLAFIRVRRRELGLTVQSPTPHVRSGESHLVSG